MQERYFPLVTLLVIGHFSNVFPHGKGHLTPEEAHQAGRNISDEVFKFPMDSTLGRLSYTDRVQSLRVPIQQS